MGEVTSGLWEEWVINGRSGLWGGYVMVLLFTSVDAGFDNYDIPYDVLWLDIEHTDGKK